MVNVQKRDELLKICFKLWKDSSDEYLENVDEDLEDLIKDTMRYRRYHCFLVGEAAINLLEKNYELLNLVDNDSIDYYKVLYISSLLHDIKKIDKKHGKAASKWLKDKKERLNILSDEEFQAVRLLIKYHNMKSKKKVKLLEEDPLDEVLKLLFILMISDKLSKLIDESNYRIIDGEEKDNVFQKVFSEYNKCTEDRLKDKLVGFQV